MTLGLIAGNGRFPFLVADAARRAGRKVVAVVVGGEVFWGDDRLEEAVEAASA